MTRLEKASDKSPQASNVPIEKEKRARMLIESSAEKLIQEGKKSDIISDSKAQAAELRQEIQVTTSPETTNPEIANSDIEKNNLSNLKLDGFFLYNQSRQLELITGHQEKQLKLNQKLICDFQGNRELERAVGLSMLMPIEIRAVKVNGQLGVRKGPSGNFFTENGEYLKILTGDQIEIAEIADETQSKKLKQEKIEKVSQFGRVLLQQKVTGAEAKNIAENAAKYELDPKLFLALQETFNQSLGHDISAAKTTEIHIAGKYLQTALRKLQQQKPHLKVNLPYSRDVLEYLITHYHLDGYEVFQSTENINKFIQSYAKLTGQKFSPINPINSSPNLSIDTSISTNPEITLPLEFTREKLSKSEIALRKSSKKASMIKDHEHNLKILKVLERDRVPLQKFVAKAIANKHRYQAIEQKLGVPWKLVAAIHNREGSMNFNTYLHNGQRLGKRTTVEPAGILFHDWESAALDALKTRKFGLNPNSSIAEQLMVAERFNGVGYRNQGRTPSYIYAGTNIDQGGKYVKDGVYDPNHVDRQLGVASMLIALKDA